MCVWVWVLLARIKQKPLIGMTWKLGTVLVLDSLSKPIEKVRCRGPRIIISNFWHPLHICGTDTATNFGHKCYMGGYCLRIKNHARMRREFPVKNSSLTNALSKENVNCQKVVFFHSPTKHELVLGQCPVAVVMLFAGVTSSSSGWRYDVWSL